MNKRRKFTALLGILICVALLMSCKKNDTGESTLRIYDGFTNEGNFQDAVPVEQYAGFADIVDVIYREKVIYQQ